MLTNRKKTPQVTVYIYVCMHVLGTLFQDVRFFSCWQNSRARESIPLMAAAIPCIKLLMASMYYRIAEWLRLDRVSKDHLVQPFRLQNRVNESKLPRMESSWALNNVKVGVSTTSLGSFYQSHFYSRSFFCYLNKTYQFVFFASCSTTGHH